MAEIAVLNFGEMAEIAVLNFGGMEFFSVNRYDDNIGDLVPPVAVFWYR